MTITGKIHQINPTEQVTDSFRKREFVVEYAENPMYPQYILFQMVQDRVDLISGFQVGQQVEVSFNLRGRQWTSPQGEVKYFNTLEAWRINPVQMGSQPAQASQPQGNPQTVTQKVNNAATGAAAIEQGDPNDLPF